MAFLKDFALLLYCDAHERSQNKVHFTLEIKFFKAIQVNLKLTVQQIWGQMKLILQCGREARRILDFESRF